jgi:hypothetical protein
MLSPTKLNQLYELLDDFYESEQINEKTPETERIKNLNAEIYYQRQK